MLTAYSAHTHTFSYSVTHQSRHIRGGTTAPVGAIFRSKAAEFHPDLHLSVCPTVTSSSSTDGMHHMMTPYYNDTSPSPFTPASVHTHLMLIHSPGPPPPLHSSKSVLQTHPQTHMQTHPCHPPATPTPTPTAVLIPVASSPALLPLLQPLWAVLFVQRQTPAWGPEDPKPCEVASPLRTPDPAGAAPPAAHTAGTALS